MVVALLAYWLGLCNASAFYDPGAQRWLNRDPIAEEDFGKKLKNLYKFVLNNPLQSFDPDGLSPSLNPQNQCWAAEALETSVQAGSRCKPIPVPVPLPLPCPRVRNKECEAECDDAYESDIEFCNQQNTRYRRNFCYRQAFKLYKNCIAACSK